jgi:RsiW-degrading membrane proteinase PrsW (M82 family)
MPRSRQKRERAGSPSTAAPLVRGLTPRSNLHLLARIVLRLAGMCACTLVVAGCSPRLAGTNDAALEYEVERDAATGKLVEPAAAATLAKARLSAAEINADVDVTPDGRSVRVVIDADAASAVDALLLWRGGLEMSVVDAASPPNDAKASPIALPIATLETALHGRALAFTFPPGAREPIAVEQASNPAARVTVSRGRAVLATLPIEEALATPLVLAFGDDITAYARAARARALLESPPLPPMRRTTAVKVPTNRALAAACALLPFGLSFAWLAFVRRFDRARPEPVWLVVATFALGGLSVIPAGLAEMACESVTPWLDPSVMTFGGQAWALPVAIVVFTLVVGFAEEGSKFLGAWSLARHRREFDEPIDGIIYGSAAALGFAAVENIKYFAIGRMSGVVIAVRAFVTVPAHMFFGAIWGFALGRQLVSRKTNVLAFVALAALAHGTFDALLSTDGMQLVSTVLVLGLAFAFVAMLRTSLRYGAVVPSMATAGGAPPTEPMPAGDLARTYFRVGSPRSFYACAAGLIACAFALTVLGGAYEYLHHRIGVVFVTLATTLLAAFGLAAYGTSETIPLDVAIDAQGVTLGGARTPWRAVVSLSVEAAGARSRIVLHTTDGVVRLGPATEETAHAIASSIRAVHAHV